jgi:hypothetical protein
VLEDRPQPLSAQPLFTFFEVASHLHRRAHEVLVDLGLSYREYALLERLHVTGIAVSIDLDAVEGHGVDLDDADLDRLVVQGLIRVVIDDSRLVRAELTTLGLHRALEASARLQALSRDFDASFDERERLSLGRLLTKLAS